MLVVWSHPPPLVARTKAVVGTSVFRLAARDAPVGGTRAGYRQMHPR